MQPCAPLIDDTGDSAAAALQADTANRAAHIDCQVRHAGLVTYVRRLLQVLDAR